MFVSGLCLRGLAKEVTRMEICRIEGASSHKEEEEAQSVQSSELEASLEGSTTSFLL